MQNLIKVEGQRYGMFTVIKRAERINGRTAVLAKCDCGNEKEVRLDSIKRGLTKSCGCINHKHTIHKLSRHPLYRIYYSMRCRCYSINSKSYKDYGGSGVVVCKEWMDDFISFYNWAISNGWKRGLQIDKDIKYKEKHGTSIGMIYSPEYCCVVTKTINARNTRTNVYIEYNGKTKTIPEWADIFKIPYSLLRQRLNRDKLPFEVAITRAVKKSASLFTGVSLHKYKYKGKVVDKWVATISLNGKQKYIGTFMDKVDAAKARDAAAKELYGKYANLNFK